MPSPRLNLVVAACTSNGIGKDGQLPWRLQKDMTFFREITSTTKSPDKQNAVIMGRKTFFSIPKKNRPLRGRINIMLSREMKEAPEGVYLAHSLAEAVSMVTSEPLASKVEEIHVIGGGSVYKESMDGPFDCRIYLTKVLAEFDCDTFLPAIDEDKFQKIKNPPNVPTDLQEENAIKFRFEVYEKVNGD